MEGNLSGRPRWAIAPYFIVDDVVTSANYYRDKLGFHYERFWGEPPCFCIVNRGGIVIMLSQLAEAGLVRPNCIAEPNSDAWDAYIWVENADALNLEFKSQGVTHHSRYLRPALRVPRLRYRRLQRLQAVLWTQHQRIVPGAQPIRTYGGGRG